MNCDQIFSEFVFEPMTHANPPKVRGVYVIRFIERGSPISDVITGSIEIVKELGWPLIENKMVNRLHRLKGIEQCPYIYIGSAGSTGKRKFHLAGRYRDFAGRHTAMFPIWALIYFQWILEYGWMVTKEPKYEEAALKDSYRQLHAGKLPALVYR